MSHNGMASLKCLDFIYRNPDATRFVFISSQVLVLHTKRSGITWTLVLNNLRP